MKTLFLDGRSLDWEGVRAILRGGLRLRPAPGALARVRRSRRIVERALAAGRTVYGVNTGFGKLSDTRVGPDHIEDLQRNLLRSHATSLGDPVPDTALLLALKANSLLAGNSGVTPGLIQHLIQMHNDGDHPLLHEKGSVGASGDLAPLAELGCAMLAGKDPYRFRAKEALSLVNGVQFTAAMLGKVLAEAEDLLQAADVAGAMSLEALRGSVKPFEARVQAVRPHPGQKIVAANVRRLLEGSEILESHRNCRKVQDAYSLRCIPQVHGAVRDVFEFARSVFLREINSVTDNPLVFENGEILSAGNFHGMPLALAADALTVALVSLANISERRIDRMTNPDLSELPAFLVHDSGLNSGYMMVQVTAAALAAEARADAAPASVHSIPTGGSKEDHVPMAPVAVRKCRRVLENVRSVLGLEVLCAAQGLDFLKPLKPGKGVLASYRQIRKSIPHLERDRDLRSEVRETVKPVFLEAVVEASRRACGDVP